MKINIFNQTKHKILPIKKLLKTLFDTINDSKSMQIIFVTEEEIHAINHQYRHVDRKTDVISFPSDELDSLGDIFVCLDVCVQQAQDFGHSFERELAFLCVHGYLHLKGYDHHTKLEENEMMMLTENILKGVLLSKEDL